MNGIKIAGFGLGLAITVAGLIGATLIAPVDPAPPIVAQGTPPPEVATPEQVAPDAPQSVAAPMAPIPEPQTDPVRVPLGSSGSDQVATPILSVPADTVTSAAEPDGARDAENSVTVGRDNMGAAAPQLPQPAPPDLAAPAVGTDRSGDLANFAVSNLPSLIPMSLPQVPFSAPEMARDSLPLPPSLPVITVPDAGAPDEGVSDAAVPIDDPTIAQPADPVTLPEEPTASIEADAPLPDLPAPARPVTRPAPDATLPTMPGRTVMAMPGQSLTRPPPVTASVTDLDLPSVPTTGLARNAAQADIIPGTPLMALVLNDPGMSATARAALAAIALPFSVVVNPMDPTAADAAKLYRDAGKEVYLLAAGLPDRATASDVDVTLSAHFSTVPLAAGLIDLPRDGVVRNARLLGDVLQVVARDGHGLITFAGGLGQAVRSAAAAGVAHTEVFRVLDQSDESPFTIRRFLDRAVFQATQLGQVVVFGEASNDAMLEALDLWMADGRADQVSMVPASAILLEAQGVAP